jgi:hypothetical protein
MLPYFWRTSSSARSATAIGDGGAYLPEIDSGIFRHELVYGEFPIPQLLVRDPDQLRKLPVSLEDLACSSP